MGFLGRNEKPGGIDKLFWRDAQGQVAGGWLDSSCLFDSGGQLRYRSRFVGVNLAFMFRVKRRGQAYGGFYVRGKTGGDLKRSETKKDSATHSPINLPSRGHSEQVLTSPRGMQCSGRLGIAKADRSDAYKRLPLDPENEYTAVVTLQNPVDGEFYGSVP